jgi:xylulokinase
VGAGTIADGDTHLYLGTSGWLGAHVPRKKTDLVSAIASVPCAVPSKFLMIALQATAGGNLTFLRDSVFFADDALGTGKAGPGFYGALDQLAESSPAGARGVIYTPWIYGERAPVENRAIRAGFHRLSLEHTRADLVRAVFEGIALNTRWILGPVERFLGRRCASIAAVGGGAKSDVWCRIYADALDRPIRQIENPIEANVRGSAFMAAVALGEMSFADVPAKVRTRAVFEPTRAHREVYDRHFREFKNLYGANKAIHRRLDEFHRQVR